MYPVAPVTAFQLALKLVDTTNVAAVDVGAPGIVANVMVLELPLVPPALFALTR